MYTVLTMLTSSSMLQSSFTGCLSSDEVQDEGKSETVQLGEESLIHLRTTEQVQSIVTVQNLKFVVATAISRLDSKYCHMTIMFWSLLASYIANHCCCNGHLPMVTAGLLHG